MKKLLPLLLVAVFAGLLIAQEKEPLYLEPLDVNPPHVSKDKDVKYDYDIVYVRAPRQGDKVNSSWPEIAHPALMDAGADLMLLHPDGSEELLVKGGVDGSITDPAVSLDGKSVYYVHIQGLKGTSQHGQPPFKGADIFKLDLATKAIKKITTQDFTPNMGAAPWSSDFRKAEPNRTYLNYGVLNMGPCPLPGNKLVFVSNRNAFRAPKHPSPCLQLFVLEEDTGNLECFGHLNLGMALHPTVLKDGRIVFSSQESQGLRSSILWGLWSIHPDGTNWGPVISAFDPGSAPNAFHFQTQLSDGSIVAEEYYNQNNSGFGAYLKLPPVVPEGYASFGPGYMADPRNPPLRFGRHYNGKGMMYRLPFTPFGAESLTRFANNGEGEADPSVLGKKDSPRVGKFTHPSAAPDNHLLTVWSPGPVNHQNGMREPAPDGGIYLIKSGKPIDEPGQMRLIKNDPKFNEQWPRAVVSYERIHGIKEPKTLPSLKNDGKLSKSLPEGSPFGLIGTSSLYKRESYPNGVVKKGSVTATFAGGRDGNGYEGLDPFNTAENGASLNWFNQGADAGKYSNDDIHAIRILAMDPTTDRKRGYKEGRLFYSHAQERLRILGEIPVRKFGRDGSMSGQPQDPDGNPDTSFLAKIPADVGFTFQTLDKDGMVLNMSQTWHQLRPGEIRHDCGGCHAHSQKPTEFKDTSAAKADYTIFDLTAKTPLLTTKAQDESEQQWDTANDSGLRFEDRLKNVEYHRDIRPILQRSCVACHTGEKPAGNLVLDDDKPFTVPNQGKYPGTYYRLALDKEAKFGHKPVIHNGSWRNQNASRYVREFQARRSLLTWKVYGKRTDGWTNDDFPSETIPGDAKSLHWKGQPIEATPHNRNRADLDFIGTAMPPPEAVKEGKVKPLTDEDRRTVVRWIDLGCPIDLDYDAGNPNGRSYGWMSDDQRPTLTLTYPLPGKNEQVTRVLFGAYDGQAGLDENSLWVSTSFEINDWRANQNFASLCKKVAPGVWELKLEKRIDKLESGKIVVAIKDRQGNLSRIERVFSVGK
ncbi:MAG: hypothetical protein K8T89_19970 [Planctomycetes bacterium]|nr:hypothetical protein [Planctomycetota bacterium]